MAVIGQTNVVFQLQRHEQVEICEREDNEIVIPYDRNSSDRSITNQELELGAVKSQDSRKAVSP